LPLGGSSTGCVAKASPELRHKASTSSSFAPSTPTRSRVRKPLASESGTRYTVVMSHDEKNKIWSEGRGSKSTAHDVLEGLDLDQIENVKEDVTKSGLIYTGNCMGCGRQWKMITKWVELASWFLGHPTPDTVPTRQGILAQPRCVCGTPQRFIVPWHEVKQHVDMGVRSGTLPLDIYQATVFAKTSR